MASRNSDKVSEKVFSDAESRLVSAFYERTNSERFIGKPHLLGLKVERIIVRKDSNPKMLPGKSREIDGYVFVRSVDSSLPLGQYLVTILYGIDAEGKVYDTQTRCHFCYDIMKGDAARFAAESKLVAATRTERILVEKKVLDSVNADRFKKALAEKIQDESVVILEDESILIHTSSIKDREVLESMVSEALKSSSKSRLQRIQEWLDEFFSSPDMFPYG